MKERFDSLFVQERVRAEGNSSLLGSLGATLPLGVKYAGIPRIMDSCHSSLCHRSVMVTQVNTNGRCCIMFIHQVCLCL